MNKNQAAAVQNHSLAILDAIAKIEMIVLDGTKEERSVFAPHIGDLVMAARFGMLESLYERFPELRANDKEEEPHVSSFLKWADVTLPKSVAVADLDAAILSVLKRNWLKTARIIFDAATACKDCLIPIEYEVIGARIQALADDGRIESQGNLSMWRHSEVRLRQD